MEIRGLTEKQIKIAAREVNATCQNWRETKHGFAFVLRPEAGSDLYRTHGHKGRRVNAICFHGHKRFMDCVFVHNPEAIVITTMARYSGKDDFDRKWQNVDRSKGFSTTHRCEC